MTGCGATPGLLTAAALAAQSYAEIHSVKITFGVGIANWEAYRATIREDIAHLPGYDVPKAQAMTDAEVEALLDSTGGLLKLENMEHADDIMLELAGNLRSRSSLSRRYRRYPKSQKTPQYQRPNYRPHLRGQNLNPHLYFRRRNQHGSQLCGPAFGYLKAGVMLHKKGIHGLFTWAEIMPLFVR